MAAPIFGGRPPKAGEQIRVPADVRVVGSDELSDEFWTKKGRARSPQTLPWTPKPARVHSAPFKVTVTCCLGGPIHPTTHAQIVTEDHNASTGAYVPISEAHDFPSTTAGKDTLKSTQGKGASEKTSKGGVVAGPITTTVSDSSEDQGAHISFQHTAGQKQTGPAPKVTSRPTKEPETEKQGRRTDSKISGEQSKHRRHNEGDVGTTGHTKEPEIEKRGRGTESKNSGEQSIHRRHKKGDVGATGHTTYSSTAIPRVTTHIDASTVMTWVTTPYPTFKMGKEVVGEEK